MICHPLFSSCPIHSADQKTCPAKTQSYTKTALVVLSLLFAIAAVCSYGFKLPTGYTIAFTILSGFFLASFAFVCLRGVCNARAVVYSKDQIDTMNDYEIFDLAYSNFKYDAIEESLQSKTYEMAKESLILRMQRENILNNEEVFCKVLQRYVNYVKFDKDKIGFLVHFVAKETSFFPAFLARVFEKMDWPSEEIKNEVVPAYFSIEIASKFIEYEKDQIVLKDNPLKKTYVVNKVTLLKEVFQLENFSLSNINEPNLLMRSIGSALRTVAACLADNFKKARDEDSRAAPLGLKIVIQQLCVPDFSASLVSSLLPFLTHIPCLVSLELGEKDILIKRSLHTRQKDKTGFDDESFDAFNAIIHENLSLIELKANISCMTEENRKKIEKAWKSARDKRLKENLSMEELLRSYFDSN